MVSLAGLLGPSWRCLAGHQQSSFTMSTNQTDISGYVWKNASCTDAHSFLLPTVIETLKVSKARRIFDLGCGNGSVAAALTAVGYDMTGVDPSKDGIEQARLKYPGLKLDFGSAYDDLAGTYGAFPAVISLEVVEHVYYPRQFATTLHSLVEPGGMAIVSTPYHGYLKNLALSLTGKMDAHFTALWDHGHIKFWSIETLGTLLQEAGFIDIKFHRVGRVPALAKSMIAVARKPASV